MDTNSTSLKFRRNPNALSPWIVAVFIAIPASFLCLFFVWPVLKLASQLITGTAITDTLKSPGLMRILFFTLFQAVLSSVATLIVAALPTYLLSKWEFIGRKFLSELLVLSFMLTTVVVVSDVLNLLPESLHNTAFAIVIVHVFFNIAVVVKVVGSLWARIPNDLENASKSLGANSFLTFIQITLPMLMPAVISAAAITFVFTFTSFGVVQIIGGPRNSTLEVEIARRAL